MTSKPYASSPPPDRSLHQQCACTLLVAVGAAYVSYRHGREFALRFGADETTATLWPLIVDGLLTMATTELWKASHRHRATGQWKAWLSFVLGIGLSLCANIASAPELNAFSIAVAACPPLALLLSVELLNQALKRHHAAPAAEPATAETQHIEIQQDQDEPAATTAMPAPSTDTNNMPRHNLSSAPVDPPGPAQGDPLRSEAYRIDAEHRQLHQRPISADNLRRQLRIGSHRARTLAHHIRQHHNPRTPSATTQ